MSSIGRIFVIRGGSRKFSKWEEEGGAGPQFWKEGDGKRRLKFHLSVFLRKLLQNSPEKEGEEGRRGGGEEGRGEEGGGVRSSPKSANGYQFHSRKTNRKHKYMFFFI